MPDGILERIKETAKKKDITMTALIVEWCRQMTDDENGLQAQVEELKKKVSDLETRVENLENN